MLASEPSRQGRRRQGGKPLPWRCGETAAVSGERGCPLPPGVPARNGGAAANGAPEELIEAVLLVACGSACTWAGGGSPPRAVRPFSQQG